MHSCPSSYPWDVTRAPPVCVCVRVWERVCAWVCMWVREWECMGAWGEKISAGVVSCVSECVGEDVVWDNIVWREWCTMIDECGVMTTKLLYVWVCVNVSSEVILITVDGTIPVKSSQAIRQLRDRNITVALRILGWNNHFSYRVRHQNQQYYSTIKWNIFTAFLHLLRQLLVAKKLPNVGTGHLVIAIKSINIWKVAVISCREWKKLSRNTKKKRWKKH